MVGHFLGVCMNYNFVVGVSQEVSLHKMYVVAVLSMMGCTNKIEAIRLIRTCKGLGLKEAKDLAEFIAETFEFGSDGALMHKRTLPIVRYVGSSMD